MIYFTRRRMRALLRSAGATNRPGWIPSGRAARVAKDDSPWKAPGSCPLFMDAPGVVDLDRVTGGGSRR